MKNETYFKSTEKVVNNLAIVKLAYSLAKKFQLCGKLIISKSKILLCKVVWSDEIRMMCLCEFKFSQLLCVFHMLGVLENSTRLDSEFEERYSVGEKKIIGVC